MRAFNRASAKGFFYIISKKFLFFNLSSVHRALWARGESRFQQRERAYGWSEFGLGPIGAQGWRGECLFLGKWGREAWLACFWECRCAKRNLLSPLKNCIWKNGSDFLPPPLGGGRVNVQGASFGKKMEQKRGSLSTLKIAIWGTEAESRRATSDSEPPQKKGRVCKPYLLITIKFYYIIC